MNELTVEVREVSKAARSALRRAGRVPGVLYGKGRDPLAVSVNQKELVKLVREHHESGLVNLTIVNGKETSQQQAIYKEITSSSLKRQITSIDFQAIREGEKVHIKVSIVTVGVPKGVSVHGGVLVHTIQELDIRVLPKDIPEQIEINVADLDIGDSIHLRDLKLEGVEILHDLDSIVASVTHVKEEKVAAPTDAAAADAAAAAAPADAKAAAGAKPAAGAKDAKGAPAKDAKAAAPAKAEKKK
jgi:large subunit ribosomal protein L25